MNFLKNTKKIFLSIFSKIDRSTLSAILGFISVAITLFLENYKEYPIFFIIRDACIIAVLISIILYFWYRLLKKSNTLNEALLKFDKNYEINYIIIKNYYDWLFKGFNNIKNSMQNKYNYEYTLENICSVITKHVKKRFEEKFKVIGFKKKVAVTIKVLIENKGVKKILDRIEDQTIKKKKINEKYVITFYRDNDTFEKKQRPMRKISKIKSNTDTIKIFSEKKDRFSCDNLSKYNDYKNESTDWKKYYNATIVVPIRFKDENSFEPYGFLAIDTINEKNKKTKKYFNLFENEKSFYLASYYANLLAIFFLLMSLKNKNLK